MKNLLKKKTYFKNRKLKQKAFSGALLKYTVVFDYMRYITRRTPQASFDQPLSPLSMGDFSTQFFLGGSGNLFSDVGPFIPDNSQVISDTSTLLGP